MKHRAVLGEKSVNNDLSSTVRKSARIEARVNKKLTSKDKENNGTDVAIAVKATKVRAKKTSKKLGWKEIDLLQRETAFKVLGFKEWKARDAEEVSLASSPDDSNSDDSDCYLDNGPGAGRTVAEPDLRAILARMGGEEMVKSFNERAKQLSSKIEEGKVLPIEEWSSLLSDKGLTLATKVKLMGQMGENAAFASDLVLYAVREGEVDPEADHHLDFSLEHIRSSKGVSYIEATSVFNANFSPEVYVPEHGLRGAIEKTIDISQKYPSRLFVTSLNFYTSELGRESELVLVMSDGEAVTTYRRQHCWGSTGLIEACCLYQTLRCVTPYELGLSPLLLDSATLTHPPQLDFGLLLQLANSGASTLSRLKGLIRLQSIPTSPPTSTPFNRATLVYRFESHEASPAIVLKISRQKTFSKEQSINARLHGTSKSPLPSHLGNSTDYFPPLEFGLCLERLSCQVNQGTLDSVTLGSRSRIVPRHLEILVTSTPTEGLVFFDAFEQGKTTPVDLINTVITAISAIEFAFHQGVMHCDISPGNILFCPADKTARLFDFDSAQVIGEASDGITGTTVTMSINRLKSLYRSKDTRIEHSPLDDVESTVYYFLYMILVIIERALCNHRVVMEGLKEILINWASDWEDCKWKANESEVEKDENIQMARAHIWDIEKPVIQFVIRYYEKYGKSSKWANLLRQRSTSSFGSDPALENFPRTLRAMSRKIYTLLTDIEESLGIHNASPLSDSRVQFSRESLWDSGYCMKTITDWIYVAGGNEGASGLLEALKYISQWRDEEEFDNLWGHRPGRRFAHEEDEVEPHAIKVERKCAELRAIFTKLKEAANPFLEHIWAIQTPTE